MVLKEGTGKTKKQYGNTAVSPLCRASKAHGYVEMTSLWGFYLDDVLKLVAFNTSTSSKVVYREALVRSTVCQSPRSMPVRICAGVRPFLVCSYA